MSEIRRQKLKQTKEKSYQEIYTNLTDLELGVLELEVQSHSISNSSASLLQITCR